MYHLLISYSGWQPNRDSMTIDRVFEYTQSRLANMFRPKGNLDMSLISRIPALFATEMGRIGNESARVGYINRIEVAIKEVFIEYSFEQEIPPIPNAMIEQLSSELNIDGLEFTRTHWAIKDVDLFRVLLKRQPFVKISPKVFTLDESISMEDSLISVMMPFAKEFDQVYETLQQVSNKLSFKCLRADDIWMHEAIIQDVVSLINKSRIVICDCTERNANVFYETGIAHTLGKDVILITQNSNDIPFDLRHLRYITYLDNNEGREKLSEQLLRRIQTILGKLKR